MRAPVRWTCTIPSVVESGGWHEDARITDVSDGGVRLEVQSALLPAVGTMLVVKVNGDPGAGLRFQARVVWVDPVQQRAGLHLIPRNRDEARQFAEWVGEIVVRSLGSA